MTHCKCKKNYNDDGICKDCKEPMRGRRYYSNRASSWVTAFKFLE